MRVALPLLLCASLAACQTAPQRIAATVEECRAMGYTPGTDLMLDCVQTVEERKALARRQSGAIMMGAGAALLSNSFTPPPPRPVVCRYFAGNYVCQ